MDLFSLIFFFFSYYFLSAFVLKKDLPLWQKAAGVALILPTAIWTFFGSNLLAFDATTCEAWENEAVTGYLFYIEGVFLAAVVALTGWEFAKSKDRKHRKEILLAGTGVSLFLGIFLAATILASILVNYESTAAYAYNFEIYGLFGMPVLLVYLGYLIVRYRAFDLRVFGTQALMIALIVLIAAEFAFVKGIASQALVALTLVLTSGVGIILVRSVKREIEQRERIEQLAKDLAKANEQQVTLIHFITHQIKGFVTKSRNIFSMLLEGDYGAVPEPMKPLVQQGFDSDTKGVATIQEILNAANIKSGKVSFIMSPFDLQGLIQTVAKDLRPSAEAKGLEFILELEPEPLEVTGDSAQLVNAYKNLIDNSIKYTPKGSVTLKLEKTNGKARFTVSDTGVGITPEDMAHLFTEGGHGKDSTKVNVESTGFGLYIVKNIVEAHKGRVWAESHGAGKGSRFIIELPA